MIGVDPSFKTPEEIAAADTPAPVPTIVHHEPPKGARHWLPHTRTQIVLCGVLLILIAGGIAGWVLTHSKQTPTHHQRPIATNVPKPIPKTIYSTLTGLPVASASINQRPVTAVMVENSLAARPQSGLSQAGVVFEALAEGGVTRFMALYQDTTPTNVGPIRSARPYFIEWAMGFDAAYAHVGGSPVALSDIKAWNVQDLNQFYYGGYYHRISSRLAPHNVYTGINTLNQLESKLGYSSFYTGFTRGKATPSTNPTVTNISLYLSDRYYNPSYTYDATTNSYNRSEYGTPQVDANTGKQLSPKVVIAMVVPYSRGSLDSTGAYYSDYAVTGSGNAYVFQNGTLTVGTWNKPSRTGSLSFSAANGQPLPLDPGQTWITAVANTNEVSYN